MYRISETEKKIVIGKNKVTVNNAMCDNLQCDTFLSMCCVVV